MILGQQEASKVSPLIHSLDAYEAFLVLLEVLHRNTYEEVKSSKGDDAQIAIGKLILIDELKELKQRVKDSLKSYG